MRGLARYVGAAVLVRGADSGATVGLVLLAAHQHQAASAGGLLVAALNAPHLAGPWLATRLDRATDRRRLLAATYLCYAVALALAAFAVGHGPLWWAITAAAAAGCCGPLLTGGLSSVLGELAGESSGHRARGWDALTYGIGGTAGPAAVAAVATMTTPLPAVLLLSVAAAAGAGLVTVLPPGVSPLPSEPLGVRAGLAALVTRPPLRRVTTLTLLTAIELGALPVLAVTFGRDLTGTAGAGAALMVAYGAGNLAGSALVTVFPLRGEPEKLALRLYAAMAVATAACVFAPGYAVALAGFAAVGLTSAMSFTATLAARGSYAPPGARAQVFVTTAGLKIAVASLGAAGAGLAAGFAGRTTLLLSAAVTGSAVLVALADRLLSRRAPAPAATGGA
jgi:MFS family permease